MGATVKRSWDLARRAWPCTSRMRKTATASSFFPVAGQAQNESRRASSSYCPAVPLARFPVRPARPGLPALPFFDATRCGTIRYGTVRHGTAKYSIREGFHVSYHVPPGDLAEPESWRDRCWESQLSCGYSAPPPSQLFQVSRPSRSSMWRAAARYGSAILATIECVAPTSLWAVCAMPEETHHQQSRTWPKIVSLGKKSFKLVDSGLGDGHIWL